MIVQRFHDHFETNFCLPWRLGLKTRTIEVTASLLKDRFHLYSTVEERLRCVRTWRPF